MNKKVVVTGLAISALAVNVMADTVVQGPVEPTAVAPIATGYNSMVGGVNSKATGTNGIILGRDNVVTGDNSTVIGGGNNTIANSETTVIGYNNTVTGTDKEITVIGSNNTASGQGAFVVGTHTFATAIDAVALGNNAIADNPNSVALGTNSVTDSAVGVDGITINGTRHIFAGEQPASVVSFGSRERAGAGSVKHYHRQLQNVSAGRIEVDSLDAVNGSQLFAVVDEVETNAKAINNNKTAIIKTQNNLKGLAVGVQMLGDIVQDNATSISNNTKAITDLGKQVNTNTADIKALNHYTTNHEGRVTQLEKDNKTIKSDVANTQKQVNVNTKDIADLKDKVGASATAVKNELNNRINQTDKRLNNLGASSAALAGLHPLDFNKNDKASYAVSYGHYRSSNAIALGAFYRPNERTMFGLGMSLGAEKQFTANVAFKVGKGSDYVAEAKGENARISQLEKLVEALTKEVATLKGE